MKTFSRNKQKERKIKIKCLNKQYRKRDDSYQTRKNRNKAIIQRKGSASLRTRINKENINPVRSNKIKKKHNLTDYFSKSNSSKVTPRGPVLVKQTYKKSIAEPYESMPNDFENDYYQLIGKHTKAEEFMSNFPSSVRNGSAKRSKKKYKFNKVIQN